MQARALARIVARHAELEQLRQPLLQTKPLQSLLYPLDGIAIEIEWRPREVAEPHANCSSHLVSCTLDCPAPTRMSAGWPSLKTIIVGMLRTL